MALTKIVTHSEDKRGYKKITEDPSRNNENERANLIFINVFVIVCMMSLVITLAK